MFAHQQGKCSSRSFGNVYITVSAVVVMYVIMAAVLVEAEDGTFFLKASKSVPRIGRRGNDYDNFFVKATKTVPRIGRRGSVIGLLNESGEWEPLPIYRTPSSTDTRTGRKNEGISFENSDKMDDNSQSWDVPLEEEYELQRVRRDAVKNSKYGKQA